MSSSPPLSPTSTSLPISPVFRQTLMRGMRQIYSFFCGSLAGVLLNLILFQLFMELGWGAFWSNAVSSGLAISITYLFVSRYTFKVATSSSQYLFFIGWYTVSIAAFSWLIDYAVMISQLQPIVCKIISLPFSFLVNFLFSSFLLRTKQHV